MEYFTPMSKTLTGKVAEYKPLQVLNVAIIAFVVGAIVF